MTGCLIKAVLKFVLCIVSDIGDVESRVITPAATSATVVVMVLLDMKVDRETVDHFRLLVVATDAGDPVRSGTLIVNVTVTDVNDNQPRFVRLATSDDTPTSGPVETRLPESASVGSAVYRVRAVDPDTGDYGRVRYRSSKTTFISF